MTAETWASGDAYEVYVGRWSRPVARRLLVWVGRIGGAWLDVGCGTGALTETVAAEAAPARATGVDRSEGFLSVARRRLPAACFVVGDAQALPVADGAVDVAVSGLMLNFVPRAEQALAEIRRVVRRGGAVGLYVWDYAEGMAMIRHFWDAAVALDPDAAPLDEGARFPLCRPAPLADAVTAVGLGDVEVRAIDVPTVFRDFDDYWTPFLGGQGPAPGYCTSLTEARRTALREHLRGALPTRDDGTIHLTARAWAVRARRW